MMFSTRLTVLRSFLALLTMKPSTCFVPDSSPALLLTCGFSISDSSILPEELATQSVRLKEEQLRREEEKVRGCGLWLRQRQAYMTLFKAS